MSVHVRDTLSGGLVEVGREGEIGLYVCGPTVYNHIHIGNARAPLFWDVAVRYLKSRGYDVTYVQNITDVEDKIINKANEEGVSWEEVVRRYTDSFHERLEMLGVGLPDVEPRATEYIPEMISLIQELIEKGHAYAPSEAKGDVYYDVESFPSYGKLSHQRPEEMRETEKGKTGFKKSPLDFALWKASKPGEPSWESPWGPGRPGWHIECSAMVEKHLPARRGHARWRHGPPLPPPRERARPELRGTSGPHLRPRLGPPRHGQLRRGQDGKVHRQRGGRRGGGRAPRQ